jgi:hypothetical protein
MAAWSSARTMLWPSNIGIVGSNTTWNLDVSLHFFFWLCLCCLLFVEALIHADPMCRAFWRISINRIPKPQNPGGLRPHRFIVPYKKENEWMTDESGFNSCQGQEVVFVAKAWRPAPSSHYNGYRGLEVKEPERKADYPLPYDDEIKNDGGMSPLCNTSSGYGACAPVTGFGLIDGCFGGWCEHRCRSAFYFCTLCRE